MNLIVGNFFAETPLRSDPTDTEYGKIIGKKFSIANDRYVNAFLGIPFAAPPTGNLRFKKPQPPAKWNGNKLCIKHGPRSPQKAFLFEHFGSMVQTSEDCLYLNVFAPEWDCPKEQPSGRAVLIFIHGGGFAIHSSANYGDLNICQNLCSKEVIVVTIHYRLGLLGFCATGDEHSIPNLGLWDQAMALKWVKSNIANFKGDPDNITISGQSAGGASVDMLCLSPHTNSLFKKGFLLGGSASCDWAIAGIEDVRNSAIEFAKKLGWKPPKIGNTNDVNKNLMEFFKKQPSEKLSLSLTGTKRTEKNPYGMFFVPVIDSDFLPEPIPELRKKAPKKQCIVGTTEYEGLLFVALANNFYNIRQLKKIIPRTFSEENFEDYQEQRQKANSLYFKQNQTKKENVKAYVKLLSDVFINNGVHEFAQDMTLAGHTVYLYSFRYFSVQNFGIMRFLFPFKASTHAMELPFLFGKGLFAKFEATQEDRKVMDKFITVITNFVIYGDPNGTELEKLWTPLTCDDTYCYLNIDKEFTMKSNYEDRRPEFWHAVKARKNLDSSNPK